MQIKGHEHKETVHKKTHELKENYLTKSIIDMNNEQHRRRYGTQVEVLTTIRDDEKPMAQQYGYTGILFHRNVYCVCCCLDIIDTLFS